MHDESGFDLHHCVVDGSGLALTVAEEPVGMMIEVSVCTCSRELDGLREVHEYRGDIPADTPRRTFPVVVVTPIDKLGEFRVLRRQRTEDGVHAAQATTLRWQTMAVVAKGFFGRDVDRALLADALADGGVLTVVGPGGVGKTRLVVEVAPELADRFDADVIEGWLADLPAGADADAVAGVLGFESAAAAVVGVAERAPLIVFDNCEHVIPGVRELVNAVVDVSDAVTILATSREPLGVSGERVMVLDPLQLPDPGGSDADTSPAVQLFLDRASAAGAALVPTARTLGTVAELCRRLDGVPLAIELAAARTRSMSPSDLLGLMDQRLDVLQRAGGSGARHDSMRAAIEVSVAMLPLEERTFFRRLGGFIGPFDLALAYAVAGEPATDRLQSLERLSRLVERSLVVADTNGPITRYRLLELLRSYAVEMLAEAGELDAVQALFVDAMATTADRIIVEGLERWSGDVLAVASSQFANLVSACDRCCEHDETPERAFRLIVPMFAAVHEGKPAEVLAVGARVLARWPVTPGPWRAEALAVVATAAALAGRASDVGRFADAVSADPDRTQIAEALVERALGFVAREVDEAQAGAHFDRARRCAAASGFFALEREVAAFAAAQRDILGDSAGAIDELRAAVVRARNDEDPFVESLARLLLARSLLRSGDVGEARRELEAAETASSSTGMPWWTAALLRTRAAVVAASPEGWPCAVVVVRRAVDFAARQGALGELALTLRGAAVLAHRAGHSELATTLAAAAPPATAISVLPELYPDEVVAVDTPATPSPIGGVVDVLRRARLALDEAVVASPMVPVEETGEATSGTQRNELCREGEAWRVTFGGVTVRTAHVKGLADLAVLIARPHTEVHCLELMDGAVVAATGVGPLIDSEARRKYQGRILELQQDIDEARDHHDSARAERAEAELDALVEQLSDAFDLHGSPRRGGTSAEKARTAVTYRIRSAQRKLTALLPDLGRHLDNSVRTGTWCSYQPERETSWAVSSRGLTT